VTVDVGQVVIGGVGIGNIVVWAFFAGRLVQTVRDIEARVGKLEAQVLKRRRTDFPELVIPRLAETLKRK
jgi:hypothetical protein